MQKQSFVCRFAVAAGLALALSFAPPALASGRNLSQGDAIVIRQTLPNPRAVSRAPLTSDQLSTTSTRFIDARRGFRPFDSVFNGGFSRQRVIGFDDNFGISRPQNRPFSFSQRTPRSQVTQFRNDRPQIKRSRVRVSPSPGYTLILHGQRAQAQAKPDLKLRVHDDPTAIPKTSGAVLVRSDGTVIQIGD